MPGNELASYLLQLHESRANVDKRRQTWKQIAPSVKTHLEQFLSHALKALPTNSPVKLTLSQFEPYNGMPGFQVAFGSSHTGVTIVTDK